MDQRQFSRLGGRARAKKLSEAQRRRISRKAGLASAKKRWGYTPPKKKAAKKKAVKKKPKKKQKKKRKAEKGRQGARRPQLE